METAVRFESVKGDWGVVWCAWSRGVQVQFIHDRCTDGWIEIKSKPEYEVDILGLWDRSAANRSQRCGLEILLHRKGA